ncbi:MAG TPA: copper-binding protein [Rhizobacter sp.]
MKLIPLIAAALLAAPTLAAAQTAAPSHDAHTAQAAPASAPATPFVDAEVRKVDLAQKKITLRHGPIPNLDMAPMTMVFQVADAKLLDGLKPGDKIRFTAEKVNGAFTVTSIEGASKAGQHSQQRGMQHPMQHRMQHPMPHHAASPYAGMQGRAIKALSPEQVAELREGRGMGASLPAELNGVPGPMHVLQLRDALKLTAQQEQALERITAAMKEQAQALGSQVVAAEAELDRSFAEGRADESSVRAAALRIGELQGQLRAVHLVAHLQTKALMSAEQIAAYNEARGYAPAAKAHQH